MYNKIKSKNKDFDNIIDINNNINNINNVNNTNNIINNNISNKKNNIIKCKYCDNKDNDKIVKCGFSSLGKQRYKCRICNKTFLNEEDSRIKHSIAERRLCITLYLNGVSMRGIQKTLSLEFNRKIYFKSITDWIKNADKILSKEIENIKEEYYREYTNSNSNSNINSNNKNINNKKLIVMEMDELFTYIKKNPKTIKENHILIKGYGLLLTGIKEE